MLTQTCKTVIAVLGIAVLLGGEAATAIATPIQIISQLPTGTTGQPSTSDDVIVDIENSRGVPGSSGNPNTIPTGAPSGSPASTLSGTRFSCQIVNGQYTVMYQPQSQPGQTYPWAVPNAMGGGWNPTKRCSEISRRLEQYRPDGLIDMQTAVENGYNTVCVTTQRVSGCRIVLTVPPGQDATATRDRVFQNLTVADSGQQTQGVNTFVNGGSGGAGGWIGEAARMLNINLPGIGNAQATNSNAINLRPFLDRADGGTGTYLRRSAITSPGRRLNPNRFR
ncbi:hypothetical protein JOY44_04915 [Phormidium sp. CLA17]|uniref:COP23 domain-containing protein n=1 Tax=Leptolyngbya sp. Cla-17 TaxID=2803751 RepID=UPI0014926401|nr:COP23 domain-containing protein [Leptolyngbya sp. Cla-17]MBM0740965.1 hypothetical protein [Leptolyngbya sp. Cla-17]